MKIEGDIHVDNQLDDIIKENIEYIIPRVVLSEAFRSAVTGMIVQEQMLNDRVNSQQPAS